MHGNTVDGLHIASSGGVWSALVFGFGGMRDHAGVLSFDPRLPASWPGLRFRFCWQGSRVLVELTEERITFTLPGAASAYAADDGSQVALTVRGTSYVVTGAAPLVVPLAGQGERIDGLLGEHPVIGGTRADGSTITAGVPEPILPPEEFDSTGELPIYAPETTAAQGSQF